MKDCKIVQDLLPSYIEKLTSKDTNEYVEGHMKTCEECTSVYNNMKADLKVNKTTPKAEIDYMKKVRKKMRIAEKLLYIILLLFIIFVLAFWREIFSFICYTDICNRYLKYQEEVQKAGKYTVYHDSNNSKIDTYYTPEYSVNKSTSFGTDNVTYFTTFFTSDILDTRKVIYNIYKNEVLSDNEPELISSVVSYQKEHFYYEDHGYPISAYFSFENKYTFWELMATFTDIRNIRIVDDNYEIDFKVGGTKGYLFRGDNFIYKEGEDVYTLRVGEVSEKDIEKGIAEGENVYLSDYFDREKMNFSENKTVKLSDCDQEAGTIVVYDFKVSKDEEPSLKYLSQAGNFDDETVDGYSQIERLREVEVTNLVTYKKFQERWKGLRDLEEKDFVNYTAIIMIDTDNTKELHYKEIGQVEKAWAKTDFYMTETDAKEDYQYSGCLLLVPNHLLFDEDGSNQSHNYMIHFTNN